MDLWQALILGLLEGLTEYLPVSSTGHLLVAQRLMQIPASDAANAYAIVIQAGAIVAVLGLYRRRCTQLLAGLVGRDPEGARLAARLVVAFLPAAVLGLAFDDSIERFLFGPWPVIAAWLAGGVLILVVGKRIERAGQYALGDMPMRAALLIGVAQCVALWPGTSRSLATILGGLAAGLPIAAAVEFSFLLGLLTLGAATAYKALQHGDTLLGAYGVLPLVVGFAAAWLSAALSVRWMVARVSQRGLGVFGWWRIGIALTVAALTLGGFLAEPSVSPSPTADSTNAPAEP